MATKPAPKAKVEVKQEVKSTLLDAYQAVILEARKEFEAQLAEIEANWEREHARKQEEDLYIFSIAKRDRVDALKAELEARVAAVAEREVKVEARELAVDHSESTIADLQKKIDEFPNQLTAAEVAGYLKGQKEEAKKNDADIRIREAEYKAQLDVSNHKIQAFQARVSDLEDTIEALREDLKAANSRVETIANNAVTAAGSKQVVVNASQASK